MEKSEIKERKTLRVNIKDVILDKDNTENVFMRSENGMETEFSQVAVIPYNDEIYCILKPVTKIEGIKDDEAIVFKVMGEGESSYLSVETDENKALSIFMEYYNLLEESLGDKK